MSNDTYGTSQDHPPGAPAPAHHPYLLWGAFLIAAAAIVASFFVIQNARANADYICTHVIEESGDCANGSWGSWAEVSSSVDAASCVATKVEKRVYTGTRVLRHIVQYLNLRTACDAGYTQVRHGDSGGSSGFIGGTVISQSSACQIEESRTTRSRAPGPSCDNVTVISTTEVTSATSNVGELLEQQAKANSKEQLNQFRESMIAANIFVKPPLVRGGGTTVVKWHGREVTECTVVGGNGVQWSGTSGERTSAPIKERTVYTLTCLAFNGTTVTDQAAVDIIPVFREL